MSNSIISRTFRHVKRPSREPQKSLTGKKAATPTPADEEREKDIARLKDFDLSLEFGPCVGITRLQRWERADRHGLNPPDDIRDLILQHPGDMDYEECLWKKTVLG